MFYITNGDHAAELLKRSSVAEASTILPWRELDRRADATEMVGIGRRQTRAPFGLNGSWAYRAVNM